MQKLKDGKLKLKAFHSFFFPFLLFFLLFLYFLSLLFLSFFLFLTSVAISQLCTSFEQIFFYVFYQIFIRRADLLFFTLFCYFYFSRWRFFHMTDTSWEKETKFQTLDGGRAKKKGVVYNKKVDLYQGGGGWNANGSRAEVNNLQLESCEIVTSLKRKREARVVNKLKESYGLLIAGFSLSCLFHIRWR